MITRIRIAYPFSWASPSSTLPRYIVSLANIINSCDESIPFLGTIHLMKTSNNTSEFYTKLLALPIGATHVIYNKHKYLLIKKTLLKGKLLKIYAERLDQIDVVSGNYYPTLKGGMLKPCEMSDEKVIDFVLGCYCTTNSSLTTTLLST